MKGKMTAGTANRRAAKKVDLKENNVKKVVIKFSDIFKEYDLVYDPGKKTAVSKEKFIVSRQYNPLLPLQAMSGIVPTPKNRLKLHGA